MELFGRGLGVFLVLLSTWWCIDVTMTPAGHAWYWRALAAVLLVMVTVNRWKTSEAIEKKLKAKK